MGRRIPKLPKSIQAAELVLGYEALVEANTFAAMLLMSTQLLRLDLRSAAIDIEDEERVGQLARRYGVSSVAMSFRLLNLIERGW